MKRKKILIILTILFLLTLNDVKTAVATFSEMWNEPSNKFLKDFDLIELINCFSTRYIAKKGRN